MGNCKMDLNESSLNDEQWDGEDPIQSDMDLVMENKA